MLCLGQNRLKNLSTVVICRENVLKTIEKQDTRIAEKLGLKELINDKQVKFASTEEGLKKEIEAAGELLYRVTVELKVKKA